MRTVISPKSLQEIAAGTRLPFARTSSCQRIDMKVPLAVFAGLFVVIAICSTMEARSPLVIPEAQTMHDENVLGPVDPNLHAGCGRKPSGESSKSAVGGQAAAHLVRAQDCDGKMSLKL